MENNNARKYLQMREEAAKIDAQRKAAYRIAVGQALLDDPTLNEKWAKFVEEQSNRFGYGLFLDETLQVMGMIKAGIPTEKIKETLSKFVHNGAVIYYLSKFVSPKIISEIEVNKKGKDDRYFEDEK